MSELEHEITWEVVHVSFDLFIKSLCFNSIKFGQVAIKHHSVASNFVNHVLNMFDWKIHEGWNASRKLFEEILSIHHYEKFMIAKKILEK